MYITFQQFNESVNSSDKIKEEFKKDGKTIIMTYNGEQDPNKDGFILHTTGYDQGIGNAIVAFKDFGTFEEATKPGSYEKGLKKFCEQFQNAITSGFCYMTAYDIVDFYKKCVIDMNIGMIPQYNDRINKYGFNIEIVE